MENNSKSLQKRDGSLVQVSRVVGENGRVDITKLSPEDVTRCREITRHVTSIESLMAFGSDIASARNEASEQLLEMNKIDRADKIGEYVTDVVNAIKDSEYQDPSKMTGFRGFIAKYIPFGTSIIKAGDKHIMARFETSKDVVDKIIEALKAQQIELKSDHNTLDNMLRKTLEYIDQLGVHYVALAQLYRDKQDELEAMKLENQRNPGTYSEQQLMEAQAFIDEIDRHGYELFLAGQYNQNILVPSIVKMKKNAADLCKNAEQISQVVVPNWEMSVSMALINKRAQKSADLQKLIKDKNNEMMVANAEMLANVTLTLEEENRRGAYDIESYRKAYSTTIEALKRSAESTKLAREERARNMEEIVRINRENARELGKIAETMKKFYGTDDEAIISDALK